MFNNKSWLELPGNRINSTYFQGFLDVSGNIILRNGGFSLPSGDVSMNGNLWVGKQTTLSSDVSMNGNIQVDKKSVFIDDVSMNGNLFTRGNTIITNTIYQIDGKYNINIASAAVGTFPNYNGSAVGPNLINIGSGNYNVVAGGLKDSIAIGNSITTAYAANSGYGIIGIGENIFRLLTTGFQNIGLGNTVATSMTTGYNNVFIGNGVATSTTSTGNTVAIGTAAGKTNTTGINNTYLGAFTDANNTTYNNSTALGYGTQITKSNQIKLGTASETVDISGNLSLSLDASFNKTVYVKGTSSFADEISQIDGKYNISITSATGTFPNYNGSAVGPNLINIGSGNYNVVAGGLKDSIAIGNSITTAYAANSGYGIIGLGKNVFPLLTTGFQNIGIGNAIATSMTTGYNNVFIGNSVATGATSTGNTVAIGANAGRGLTTGINNTFLGAFTSTSSGAFNNSTAIGYGAQITKSNQIKIGISTDNVAIPGRIEIGGIATMLSNIQNNSMVGYSGTRATSNSTIPSGFYIDICGNGFNSSEFNGGNAVVNNIFTAPVNGIYFVYYNI